MHAGTAAPAALTGGFQQALWVLGAIALLAVPAIFALVPAATSSPMRLPRPRSASRSPRWPAQADPDVSNYNYMPRVELMYWSMRVMAILGVVMFGIAAVGAWLYRTRRLEKARWFGWIALVAIAFPYIAAISGWILTEMGRQPWIVQNLLKTSQAVSPSVSTATVATSLGVFVALYVTLGVVDFLLMRRYARLDPPEVGEGGGLGETAGVLASAPAPSYGGT